MSEERRFSREFKLAALGRMLAGENVSALARELGLRRKYLHQWRERLRNGLTFGGEDWSTSLRLERRSGFQQRSTQGQLEKEKPRHEGGASA